MQWHKAAVSWLAQQHRKTKQKQCQEHGRGTVYPKHCSMFIGVNAGTRLLSAGLAQQHRNTKQAVYPKHSRSALVFGG